MQWLTVVRQQYQLVEEIILKLGLGVYLLGNLGKQPYQTTNEINS
jgi:hypothetical protein